LILYNLVPLSNNAFKTIDTRATLMLYSNNDSIKYCFDEGVILKQDTLYYYTPKELINFIGIENW
jgi:hypothetical protein